MVESEEKRRYSEIYQFLLSSEASSVYDEVSEALLLRAIYEAEDSVSIEDIKSILNKLFNIEKYPSDFISENISLLEEKGEIIKSNGKYFLSPETKDKLEGVIDQYKKIKDDFFNELEKSFVERGFKEISRSKIEKFSYDFLGELFSKIGYRCAEIRSGKPSSSTPWIKEFNSTLNTAIDKNFKDNKEKVKQAFLAILEDPTKKVSLFLHTLLESYILSSTLNIDPEMKKFQDADFSKMTIYLDTNILIDLVCEKSRCEAPKTILKNTQDLGVEIKVAKKTIEEFRGKLNEADKRISEGKDTGSNPFVEHFYMDSLIDEWEAYYRKMKNIGDFLDEYPIDEIEQISDEELMKTEDFSKMSEKVKKESFDRGDFFTPSKGKYPTEHDAFLLLSIKNMVDNSETYTWIGPSTIFVTNDSYLPTIRSEKDFPIAFQLDEWNEIIHPFISPKAAEENSEKVYAHLFASKFPELSRMTETSPASLIKNILPKEDYDKISAENLKEILSKEYVNKKLKEYTEAESIEEADKTKESIQKIIRREVKQIIKENDKKGKKRKSQEKRDKEKSQRAFTLLKYTVISLVGYLLVIILSIPFLPEYTWSIISWGAPLIITLNLFIWGWGFIDRYSWSEFVDLLKFKEGSD